MPTIAVAASSNGDNTLLAGIPGRRIRITGGILSYSGTVNAKFTDGAGGTALTGLYYGVVNSLVFFDFASEAYSGMKFHFETSQGSALVLNLSAGVPVGGHLTYEVVT